MADRWGGRAGGQTGLRRAAPAGVLAMNRRCGCAAAGAAHRPWSVAGGLAARKWRAGSIFVPAGVLGHVAKKVAKRENFCNHLRKQYFLSARPTGNTKSQWNNITYEVRNGDPPLYAISLDCVVLVIEY